jgi:ADP-ribose pyrophosphatase YjhB (NUDIX family)
MEIKDRELHRITSTAIIHKNNKYLLVRRSLKKKAFPGKWTVPGGGLEIEDYIDTPKTTKDHWYFAIENSLKREIKEESNLEVGKLKYLLDIAFIRPDGIPTIILSFYCPYKSGEVKLDKDNIDFAWVTYEEAKKYDLVEGLLEEIEMVDKILKGEDKVEYKKN